MSLQLEREMVDRVNRFRQEAQIQRSLPRSRFRAALAEVLRSFADRLEPKGPPVLPGERQSVALPGRNH